jgi:hypothetical protein
MRDEMLLRTMIVSVVCGWGLGMLSVVMRTGRLGCRWDVILVVAL